MAVDTREEDPHMLPVDQHVVPIEGRYELLDGELTYVPPAEPAHGQAHVTLGTLVQGHLRFAFLVGADILTRTSEGNDFAPDVSIYPREPHPKTGGRQLEQIAFEIVNKQSMSVSAHKANELITRGVRRIFAIDVQRRRVLEWARRSKSWRTFDRSHIEDRVFFTPLPVADLLDAANRRTNSALARALLIKRNPVIVKARARSRARGKNEGKIEGKIESLLRVLQARGIHVDDAARAKITAERDVDCLDRWLERVATVEQIAELVKLR